MNPRYKLKGTWMVMMEKIVGDLKDTKQDLLPKRFSLVVKPATIRTILSLTLTF